MARTPAPVAPPASRMVPRFAIRPANSYLPAIAVVELRMGNWTPSIVPSGDGGTVYLVLDDFGYLGRCWRETDTETAADLDAVIQRLAQGRVQRSRSGHRLQHR
jgi:hypothetical protein